MSIKILYTFIAFIALGFYSITNSYNTELAFLDEGKTIKELKQNIDTLDKTNEELNNDLENLNTDYKLKSLFKKDLLNSELNKIKNILFEYNINKGKLETILLENAKTLLPVIEERKLLLEEKRKLYNALIPYIDNELKEDYLEYIKGDAKIFNKQNNVVTDIIGKKEILNIKVETIETKIREHKIFIDQSIKKVIKERLDNKINSLNNNETFKILNIDSKIKIIDKTIVKIKIKLQNLENNKLNSNSGIIIDNEFNLLDKKIQTYNIAVDKLELFKESLK